MGENDRELWTVDESDGRPAPLRLALLDIASLNACDVREWPSRSPKHRESRREIRRKERRACLALALALLL